MKKVLVDLDNLSPRKRELFARALKLSEQKLSDSDTIPKRVDRKSFPLSYAQERLWFIDQLQPGSTAYNMLRAIRLLGGLRIGALERAVNEIVRRHEALRTRFEVAGDKPVQVMGEYEWQALPVVDLMGVPEPEREAAARRLVQEESGRAFDLSRGPLMRAQVLRVGPENHIILCTLHHIISDGWSMGVLNRELEVLYEAFAKGQSSPLEELPVQYGDFAVWQRQWLQGEVWDRQMKYWQGQLAGLSPLQLPADHARPVIQTFNGAIEAVRISAETAAGLRELGRREGVTLFMTLLAGFEILLGRYSGQEDIAVGTPIANRHMAEVEKLIGFFVNTLVMRVNIGGDPTVRELLKRVREMSLGAYGHQDLPFEKLVEELQPERDLGRNPLVQVVFALQNAPDEGVEMKGIQLQSLGGGAQEATRFDLEFYAQEQGKGLGGWIKYNTDLYESGTIRRMAGHLERLLGEMVGKPEGRLSELEILGGEERRQLLEGWNDTQREYPRNRCIHELIEEQAERTPGAVAVVCGEKRLTYRELNEKSNQLAHYLRGLGVGPEVLVGICVERSLEMVVGLLGILKAGGAYVPLDPDYPKERLAFMLEDARVGFLLTEEKLAGGMLGYGGRCICLDRDRAGMEAASEGRSESRVLADNAAYVIYTSGSTGQPKGAVVTHYNLVRLLEATQPWFEFGGQDVWTFFHSHAFDFSVWEIWGALVYGGKVVVVPYLVSRAPEEFYKLLIREGVTVLNQTPSAFAQLIRAGESLGWEGGLALRYVIFGGEALEMRSLKPWFERHGEQRPQLVNMYGITETTVHVTYRPVGGGDVSGGSVIGVPIPDLAVYLLDSRGELAPMGAQGELYVGGKGVARGYLNRPELTAERFVPDPFGKEGGQRLYRPGDLGRYLAGGDIEFLGRRDEQVKVRGYRIELGEIESVLAEHPEVRESVVMAREEEPGGKRLVGYVVLQGAGSTGGSELRRYVKERLPEYMVPSAIMILERMPLTVNGKLDRKALPAPERTGVAEGHTAPRTGVEELLAGIFEDVLKVERVGVEDNFFELGGHSLLATQLMSRVREVFQVELPLKDLFEAPTVGGLSGRVERQRSSGPGLMGGAIGRAERQGALVLSYAQERLWFLDQLRPGSPDYNLPGGTRIGGRLEVGAWEQAINEIVRRHEALRTTFSSAGGKPVQVIHPSRWTALPVIDLCGLEAGLREQEMERMAREQWFRPFDLEKGPLVRVSLWRMGREEHVMLYTLHHIISDGWSMGVLNRELEVLYEAFAKGQPSPLEELPVQYGDFAVWQRQWLQGEVWDRHLDYWQGQLADLSPLQLPADHARPVIQTFNGATEAVRISAETAAGLRELGRREGVTLFMTLLAGFEILLGRYSGQEDIAVGTPIANRTRGEIEGLIGFFVNTLVMRVNIGGDPTVRELLKRVREMSLGAYGHQDLPFEKLVEELQPERDLGRNPLVGVLFALQNAPDEGVEMKGIQLQSLGGGAQEATRFDLEFYAQEQGKGLGGWIKYNTDLYESGTIRRMAGHLERLLGEMVGKPEGRLSELEILGGEERRQLLEGWNDTQREYPRNRCIHELIEEQAERTPGAVAVVCGEKQLSYQELNRRSNQLAHYLRGLGVGPEVLVGICVERSLEMVVGLLGILKAGGAYVPLDPKYPKERLESMLRQAQLNVLVTQKRFNDQIEDLINHVCGQKKKLAYLDELDATEPAPARVESEVLSLDLAYVLFTSGSSGEPKGVQVSHQALVNFIESMKQEPGIGDQDRMMAVTTLSFDIAGLELWLPLTNGATVVIAGSDVTVDGKELARLMEKSGVTVMQATPSTWRLLLGVGWQGKPGLKVLCGGEPWSEELAEQLAQRSGSLWNMYGPTETTIWSSVTMLGKGQAPRIRGPIANTQLYVLDRYRTLVPCGVVGELYIGGDGLARGYLNRPELTAEKFVPDPFSNAAGQRMYSTGDLVRYNLNGSIEFIGRADYQIKLRGYRIELGEIENVLSKHPQVQQSVVAVRGDESEERMLVGYVVMKENGSATTSDLKGYLKERLPDYMVPAAILILGQMPLTASGKVDRKALPVPKKRALESAILASSTPLEEVIAGMFSEVLRVEQVGVQSNFFELGGHSLLATQLVSRVREVFAVDLALRNLFESPTVAGLSQRVEALRGSGMGLMPPEIQRVKRDRPLPLSFAQERLWFLDQLERGTLAYNIPRVVRFQGGLSVDTLARAVNEIIRRHAVLRTTFETTWEGQPVQVIHPYEWWDLPQVDLESLNFEDRERETQRLIREESGRPFDLARGPIVRFHLLRLAADDYLFLCTLHHIALDEWSMGVLNSELGILYEAFASGQPSPLPELLIQYADYAVWQRSWLQGEVLEKQLSYWKDHLGDLPVMNLPTDHKPPATRTHHGEIIQFALSPELTKSLEMLAQKSGTTLYMVLFGAFAVLLAGYSGEDDLVIGSAIANRNRKEIEPLIGFFVNTLALRIDLSGDPTFTRLLAQIREMALESFSHQDLPFDRLVEELAPKRDASRNKNPLFQVMFALQNTPDVPVNLPGLKMALIDSGHAAARFDLELLMSRDREHLVGTLIYSLDIFIRPTIQLMVQRFEVLLKNIVKHPDYSWRNLQIVEQLPPVPLLRTLERHYDS